jgi:hypothetical protein
MTGPTGPMPAKLRAKDGRRTRLKENVPDDLGVIVFADKYYVFQGTAPLGEDDQRRCRIFGEELSLALKETDVMPDEGFPPDRGE